MSGPGEIVRIAARGDGVTAEGRHVAGAVPGDRVAADGGVLEGAHHVTAPCPHFGPCGGCQLQHADDTVLADFVRDRVLGAAARQGIETLEILPVHLSPPATRRRASLHGLRTAKGAVLGFRAGGSHRIVDMKACPVLHEQLFALSGPLRAFIAAHGGKGGIEARLTLADQGPDVALTNVALDGLAATEAALDLARENGLARLSIDQGYGTETMWEPEPVSVTLSGIPVDLPPGAFLQATIDAQERMASDAIAWIGDASVVADLFAGLGTFAFGLLTAGPAKRKVLGVEADRAAHLAFKAAGARTGGRALALHRDLFRAPLQPSELARFDAVLLDPPRAGAKAQVAEIAASELARVLYVSCNPASWARDAARLVENGFRCTKLRPVGQFRWSTHVELVSLFERA
ncbi:MAG: class I SAM-dependent RNA methyltransferase [Erythrobacter sp.]|uniref:class I SAM-dependent RNA methyltransferase n=1 Tax=Erythrobacter sp. TaxID=1042 RepID=UPI0032EF0FC6